MFEEEKCCLAILKYINCRSNKILEELYRKLFVFLGVVKLIEENLKNVK